MAWEQTTFCESEDSDMGGTLRGKTALVTGASRGIGRAIAIRLAREGALVAVHYGSNAAAASATVAEIVREGGDAFPLRGDVAVMGEIDRMFRELDGELFARSGDKVLDILINNAGIGLNASLETTSEEIFDRQFGVNVKGLFYVTQHASPRLRDGGRIINISSQVTRRAYPDCTAYTATKGAVNALTLALAGELGKRGITVNAVAPGMTVTDFITGYLNDAAFVEMVKANTTLGRIGEPADIAGMVVCLASPDAGWVTGQVIYATGGMQL